MKIAEKVAEGAKLLDRVRPNWPREFNQHTLDMRHHLSDLLTQIFGSRVEGIKALGIRWSETPSYGFDIAEAVHHRSPKWKQLRDAWCNEANKRLATLAPAK